MIFIPPVIIASYSSFHKLAFSGAFICIPRGDLSSQANKFIYFESKICPVQSVQPTAHILLIQSTAQTL